MIRRLYDWTLLQAARPNALWVLAAISFIESSVFPIPPDVLLIPMVLAARDRAWLIAGVATVASVAGGLAGYAIGAALFETVGRPIFEFYGYIESFDRFRDWFEAWGFWIVLGAGLTPFPYKVITIASGVVGMDLVVFLLASVVARGGRFYLEAALLWLIGPPIRRLVERRLGLIVTAGFAALLGGFVVAHYVLNGD